VNAEASDLSLVQRAQKGEAGAFDALVRRYQHKVVKLVMRYVRNQTEAEDIAQEAFIKAYRALPRFRGDSAFYTWLYRIAINTAKNALAARARNPVQFDLDRGDGRDDGDAPFDLQDRMTDTATPEALALTEEIRATVTSAIEQLPEDLRTAIMLRELEGLSYEEIATAMDCPVGTVRSRIFRAREAVDARLREIFDGGLGRGEVAG
jgi:RNA polymerase sigma-70 factor (ECF subfamily)